MYRFCGKINEEWSGGVKEYWSIGYSDYAQIFLSVRCLSCFWIRMCEGDQVGAPSQ